MKKLKKRLAILSICISFFVLLIEMDDILLKVATSIIAIFVFVWSILWFAVLDEKPKPKRKKQTGISPFIGRIPNKKHI